MGNSLATQISSNLLVRTSIVTVLVVGFLGVASGVLPVHCLIGTSCSPAASKPAAQIAPAGTPAVTKAPEIAVVTPMIQKTAPSLTNNDVLAATFAQLKVELTPPTNTNTSATPSVTGKPAKVTTPAPATQVATNTSGDTGLTTRVVRAISIKPDGTPILGNEVAVAYGEPSRTAVIPPPPALDAAARIGAGQMPVAEATPTPKVTANAEPTNSGNATVLGSGANVRSNPSKSGGKVVFALAGGEAVTIVDSKRGWLRIKDDQGRTGWIYADGVKRG